MGALRQPSSSGKPSVAASGAGTVHNNKAATSDREPDFFGDCFKRFVFFFVTVWPFLHLCAFSRDA